ncbi:MAG: hydrogenase expression/formation protein HypE [Deltaproteobacteria bacterium]|nr:hydrogenase expression/formation protein HypE [Deltaproteobacteria bacterium]
MHELIEQVFAPVLLASNGAVLNDAAVFQACGARLAMTTDSFVVDPIFFPGGDIGEMAVYGTVNDLAVSGARPLFLSAAFILEEGLPLEDLRRIVASMKRACDRAGVAMVTGDTKVVNRGKGDKVFVNTTGIGAIERQIEISADRARPGDKVLLSGAIGAHGVAIMLAREDLDFERPICSDTAPLNGLVEAMLGASLDIHCMRDLTRGGLASALNEIALSSRVGFRIREDRIPIQDEVKGACEILGLDPLHVANEGKLVAVVGPEQAEKILASMQKNACGKEAALIGEVVKDHPGRVVMKTGVGGLRIVDMLAGAQLPRIC